MHEPKIYVKTRHQKRDDGFLRVQLSLGELASLILKDGRFMQRAGMRKNWSKIITINNNQDYTLR